MAVTGNIREQSSIAFPYVDLDTAITVARALLDAGAVPLSRDQLAAQMGTSTNSGTFLNKLSATRLFGLAMIGGGEVQLSPLGFEILDADLARQKAARAEAFLRMPLFKKVYDEFRGKQLPPRPQGFEQMLVKFGVAFNQRSTARMTLDKSAMQAGYFPNGNTDRLIEPILARANASPSQEQTAEVRPSAGSSKGEAFATGEGRAAVAPAGLHPFIQGLIEALPPINSEWPMPARAKWLQAAANNFDLMYKGDGTLTVLGVAEEIAKGK